MSHSISVTSERVSALRDVVAVVDDAREAERHDQAVARYRAEREDAAPDEPWWVDVGGEGEPC
jgi:hypothetical protein